VCASSVVQTTLFISKGPLRTLTIAASSTWLNFMLPRASSIAVSKNKSFFVVVRSFRLIVIHDLRLNGNDIPGELPAELVPPSRDLDTSVNFLQDILKNDTRTRSPSSIDGPISRFPERSFNSNNSPRAGNRQDATVYKHSDSVLSTPVAPCGSQRCPIKL